MRQPPEWAEHDWVWIGFPSHGELWDDDLPRAQAEVAAFASAVHADGAGEGVRLVAAHAEAAETARFLAGPAIEVIEEPFGDIWLRDTGPIVLARDGRRLAASFLFNGWGGKYRLMGDDTVGANLAKRAGLAGSAHDWILEGGAIDVDGSGLAVTTEQCLLHPNRNPGLDRAEVEARLRADLGLEASSGSAMASPTTIPTAMSTISRGSSARDVSPSRSPIARTIRTRRSMPMPGPGRRLSAWRSFPSRPPAGWNATARSCRPPT